MFTSFATDSENWPAGRPTASLTKERISAGGGSKPSGHRIRVLGAAQLSQDDTLGQQLSGHRFIECVSNSSREARVSRGRIAGNHHRADIAQPLGLKRIGTGLAVALRSSGRSHRLMLLFPNPLQAGRGLCHLRFLFLGLFDFLFGHPPGLFLPWVVRGAACVYWARDSRKRKSDNS